jgi:hypothetical protein
MISATEFNNVMSEIQTANDSLINNLTTYVQDAFAKYGEGELEGADILNPTDIAAELDQNYQGSAVAGIHAVMNNVPSSAGKSVELTIDVNGSANTFEGEVFTNAAPSGGFQAGNTYDPADLNNPVYFAYQTLNENGEITDDGFIELLEPFKIVSITNADGESLDSFKPEKQFDETYDTTELKQLLEDLRAEKQERAQEAADNGGGGGFPGSDLLDNFSGTGALAGVAAVAVVLFGLQAGD